MPAPARLRSTRVCPATRVIQGEETDLPPLRALTFTKLSQPPLEEAQFGGDLLRTIAAQRLLHVCDPALELAYLARDLAVRDGVSTATVLGDALPQCQVDRHVGAASRVRWHRWPSFRERRFAVGYPLGEAENRHARL